MAMAGANSFGIAVRFGIYIAAVFQHSIVRRSIAQVARLNLNQSMPFFIELAGLCHAC